MENNTVYRPCDACGEFKMSSVTGDGDSTTDHLDNALVIAFDGGYGMFIDPIPHDEHFEGVKPGAEGGYTMEQWREAAVKARADYEVIICHECAHDLCDKVPWINKLLEPKSSHAHRAGSVPDDHVGWDNEKVPFFEHDCDGCTFLGGWHSNEANQYGSVMWDLYVCGDSLIARHGDDGPEYLSAPVYVVENAGYQEARPSYPLVEAFRRATAGVK